MVPKGPLGEPRALGDLSAEVDREASPEGTSVRVPQHGRFVVVSVNVERRAQDRGAFVMPDTAAAAPTARRAVVDRAEAGRGEGGEDARMRCDLLRCAFAAAESGGDQVKGVGQTAVPGPGACQVVRELRGMAGVEADGQASPHACEDWAVSRKGSDGGPPQPIHH